MTSKRNTQALAALVAGVALSFGAQAAGDAAAGAKKNFQCQGCHGIPGWKTAFPEVYPVPKLGGQHAQYIVTALKAYKKGERDHQTMRAITADMSDQDIEDLAAYYGASAPAATAAKK
jgi:cytochrome c553